MKTYREVLPIESQKIKWRGQTTCLDNFALFIQCSEGIDAFANQCWVNRNRVRDAENSDHDMQQPQNSFGQLESFELLIDNTNNVQKVQSALAVLQHFSQVEVYMRLG